MDKSSGANTTQGATGQNNPAGDFEVHPVGTAERLRRLGLIGPIAAELLQEQANDIHENETVNGEWGDDVFSRDAKEAHEKFATVAAHLRVLCTPPAVAPAPEVKPDDLLPDEDFTIPIYPWPSGEVLVDD